VKANSLLYRNSRLYRISKPRSSFGCRCFPYLRDYSKNKFGAKSYPCVFLGYSPTHKGYRCLHPPSKRVYLSRHVVFDETIFPYANPKLLYSPSSCSGTLSAFSEFSNNFLQHHTCDTSQSPRVQSTPSLGVDTCSTPPAVLNSAPVIEQSPSVAAASAAPHNVLEHSPSIAATSAAPHTVPPTPAPSPQGFATFSRATCSCSPHYQHSSYAYQKEGS
jgi:hypothetical protein